MALVVANTKEPESEEKPQKSLNEKQQVSLHVYIKKNVKRVVYFILNRHNASKAP